MRLIVNDIEMSYEISGKDDAPVVVLSHSLGSSTVMWTPQIEELCTDYQVLRYDTRGHGDSEAPDGAYDLDLLGDDAVALLDALDIEQVHWVGLSMGGMIGQSIALRYPERLLSLALCDTMAEVPDEMQGVWLERIETARKSGMGALADATIERWFTKPFRDACAQAVAPIRRQFNATAVAGYVGCCEAIRRLNYLPRLSSVKIPTLVVVGEHDQATPVAAADAIHNQIALSERVLIHKAAHLSNIEQEKLFNATMLDFLARHSTG